MTQSTTPPLYCPSYCEENIWHLCQSPRFESQPTWVVFISNAEGCCPLWQQRAGAPDEPVLWDYHVILLSLLEPGAPHPWGVWDLDSRLPSPTPLSSYLQETCRGGTDLPEPLRPQFRVLSRQDYLHHFASDRAHMLSPHGDYLSPPPPWPCIGVPTRPSNLHRFIAVDSDFIGEVMPLQALVEFFKSPTRTPQ